MLGHVAGLDIGSTKVACLIADVRDDGRAEVVGVGRAPCKGLKRGVIVDMEETVRSIETAVREAEGSSEREVDQVVVGLTGEHITLRDGEGKVSLTPATREITAEDVRRAVDGSRLVSIPPDQEILDVVPCRYCVDGRDGIRRPIGISGARLEVTSHIVIGATSCIQNLLRAVSRAGIETAELVVEPLAVGPALLTEAERDAGVVLLDVGGGTCDVSVFKDGALQFFTAVPVGGQYMTGDISTLLRTSMEEAERLKLEHGTVRYQEIPEDEGVEMRQIGKPEPRMVRRRMLGEIIQARAWEMLMIARSRLDAAGCLDAVRAGVVLTGGGCRLDGLQDLAGDVLNGSAARIAKPDGVDGLDGRTDGPEWAGAAGLIACAAAAVRQEAAGEQRGDWLRTIRRHLFARDR